MGERTTHNDSLNRLNPKLLLSISELVDVLIPCVRSSKMFSVGSIHCDLPWKVVREQNEKEERENGQLEWKEGEER